MPSTLPLTQQIWAQHALTIEGWQSDVSVSINAKGKISAVSANQPANGIRTGVLLPAVANCHSHAFQRAMAGMTETRGPDPTDSFWSWRKLMYRFLEHLTPDDAESIAAFGQMQMLESGYTSVGEFHYLHHQASGQPYTQPAEMCERIIAAATQSGIGLTLLPVLYEQGGCDGRELTGGQKRFGHSFEAFAKLFEAAQGLINQQTGMSIGIAPHSLRAVSQPSLAKAYELAAGKPFHIHIAEQEAEVQQIQSAWNSRPVEWLMANMPVDHTWCLIHATHMLSAETAALAKSGAVVGLCPITESNLGDGIFNGVDYKKNNGRWSIGTDSNVRISLSEELRTLEYSQRLKEKGRAIYATTEHSSGRALYDTALKGGASALQRQTGVIAIGQTADLLALDIHSPSVCAVDHDQWLDAWIFADDDRLISDVWAAGQHVVSNGKHINRERIEARYKHTLRTLLVKL